MGSWRNWRNALAETSGPAAPYVYCPQKKMRLCVRGLQKNWRKRGLFRIPAGIQDFCSRWEGPYIRWEDPAWLP